MEWKKVYNFWFQELQASDWFTKSDDLDKRIKDNFLSLWESAVNCELYDWRYDVRGRLSEIILIDQFSRNMFRNSPKSFQYDALALVLSQETIQQELDQQLKPIEKSFLYMPFMHSESISIHKKAVELFSQEGLENNLDYEIRHKEIIERFGRYPHRNDILGRQSTEEEIEFLKQPNSSF